MIKGLKVAAPLKLTAAKPGFFHRIYDIWRKPIKFVDLGKNLWVLQRFAVKKNGINHKNVEYTYKFMDLKSNIPRKSGEKTEKAINL